MKEFPALIITKGLKGFNQSFLSFTKFRPIYANIILFIIEKREKPIGPTFQPSPCSGFHSEAWPLATILRTNFRYTLTVSSACGQASAKLIPIYLQFKAVRRYSEVWCGRLSEAKGDTSRLRD